MNRIWDEPKEDLFQNFTGLFGMRFLSIIMNPGITTFMKLYNATAYTLDLRRSQPSILFHYSHCILPSFIPMHSSPASSSPVVRNDHLLLGYLLSHTLSHLSSVHL